jgi:GT2 family glycosyltransferase
VKDVKNAEADSALVANEKALMSPPKVSVLIVSFNGYEFTRRCILSVFTNTYHDYEIVLVDNGSSDQTVEKIRSEFGDRLKIVALPENIGPSAARNRGMEVSTGEIIAALDNDTEPDPEWLVNGVARMLADPGIGALQCRLMINKARNRFDYVGDFFGSCGFLIQPVKAGDLDVGQAENEAVIFSAKSAGMLFRRDAFFKVGGFDDDYFIFVEETDLALRMWLAGYTALYLPTSVVYHEFSSSRNTLNERHTRLVRFHGSKNYVCTLLKSLEWRTLVKILPVHISLWLAFAFASALKRQPRTALWIVEGLWWNVLHFPQTMKKRRAVQRFRVVSDADIWRKVGRRDTIRNLVGKTRSIDVTSYVSGVREGRTSRQSS